MILLDTHAWIWHLSDPSQLSAAARAAIDDARRDLAVHVSSIGCPLVSKDRRFSDYPDAEIIW